MGDYHTIGAQRDRARTWALLEDIAVALRQVAASNLIVAQATLLTARDTPIEDWRTINASIMDMNRELNT